MRENTGRLGQIAPRGTFHVGKCERLINGEGMAITLRIRLLGGFELIYEGEHVRAIEKSMRLQALLAYLLLHAAHPQSRSVIAFTFWPDSSESQAHTNLRKLIFQLQNWLPDAAHHLAVQNHALQWNVTTRSEVDLFLVSAALDALEERPDDAKAFAAVRRLHHGPLLPGIDEDWLIEKREALHQRIAQAVAGHIAYYEQQGAFDKAMAVVQYALALDPLSETSYRRLMRLRAMAGDRSGALYTYQQARTLLQEELGVEPAAETQQLAQRILSGANSRGAIQASTDSTPIIPLVGRQEQWKRAQGMSASLQSGDSHCLLISGEAGIGKTRFAEELLARAHLDGYLVARTRSYAAQGDLAYAPVAELLRRSDLQHRVAGLPDVWLGELSLILPELLVDRPHLAQTASLSEGGRRLRFYDALCNLILDDGVPVMLLFDDLQWCDEETFTWLHYLLRREHQTRLIVMGTYRDDEVDLNHPLRDLTGSLYREDQLLDIRLPLLEKVASSELAEVIYNKSLTGDERLELFESTRGNPLFIVELVRARLNGLAYDSRVHLEDARTGAALHLPPKLFALIQHRLRRLSPEAQDVLQLSALIARTIPYQLFLTASQEPEKTITAALTELCHKRVLREQEAGRYDFTHDRLRDVVLAGIGDPSRRLLSRNIAAAYESIYDGCLDDKALDEIAGELAVAHEKAGQYRDAINYYQRAARTEIRRGAYKRAQSYLRKALALIELAGEGDGMAELELNLQLSSANVARVIRRNTVPEARAAFSRALQLSEDTGDQMGRFQALFGLAQYYMTDAHLAQASHYCAQSITVAAALDDAASLVRARLMFGFISLVRGQLHDAKEHLQWILTQQMQEGAAQLTTLQGQDTMVMANLYLACTLWMLGYPQQSDERMEQAEAIATELGLPINLAFVCFYQMLLSQIKHDIPAAGRFAGHLVHMSEAYDIGFTLIAGQACQAYVDAARDPHNPVLVDAFAGHLDRYHQHVSRLSQPFYLSLFARLLIQAERYREAGDILDSAINLVETLDDRYSTVELHRLHGQLVFLSGAGNAEQHFQRALDVASEQGARMLQLRAATSLGRLWQQQGKNVHAQRLLAPVYNAIEPDPSSTEWREARALLDDLYSQPDSSV